MRPAASRRARAVTGAQREYAMTMAMLMACVVVVVLFAGYMLQVTAASVTSRLAHLGDQDYQVSTSSLLH